MKGIAFIISALVAVSAAVQCPSGASSQQELILQHEDCNKFYKCVLGEPYEQACSDGLHFNLEISQCDQAENVVCGNRKTESVDENKVNNRLWWLIPGWRPTPSAPVATSTTPRPKPTPPPTPSTKPPKPTPPPKPTTPEDNGPELSKNGCPVDLETHWLLPNVEDCNSFFSCVWGVKVLQQCPDGLNFNAELQVCDWPWTARCLSLNKHYEARRNMIQN